MFVENNDLFVLLKYLFLVVEINYLALKNYFLKISWKHRQVWSCFEDLVIKKIIVQSEFNFNALFRNYKFF